MCGRCACSCDPADIQRACAFRRKSDPSSVVKPAWLNPNDQKYFPSYNISPQTNTPVLLSGEQKHILRFLSKESVPLGEHESTERVVQTMKWGLIPSWHKGADQKSFPLLLNNCRYDTMLDKPSFNGAVSRRQRCVVLAEGFYEWKRESGKSKQPYYIYWNDKCPSDETLELEKHDQNGGSCTTKLLTLAGLFDAWSPDACDVEESLLYSYTIITVNATDTFNYIHNRMPAVLENETAISQWLDPSVPTVQAIKYINQYGSDNLSWHPVSSLVNNARNKSSQCITKIDLHPAKKANNTLLKWFGKSPRKTEPSSTVSDTEESEPCFKKSKLED